MFAVLPIGQPWLCEDERSHAPSPAGLCRGHRRCELPALTYFSSTHVLALAIPRPWVFGERWAFG